MCYVPDLLVMCGYAGPMLTCGAVRLLGYVFGVVGPLVMWLRVLARWLVVWGYQPIGYMCGLPVPQPCLPGSCMSSQVATCHHNTDLLEPVRVETHRTMWRLPTHWLHVWAPSPTTVSPR